VPKQSEILLRTQILDELQEFVDWACDSEEDEDPYADLPGTWLDELEGNPGVGEPIVVLDPRIFYGDAWSPPLLDELLFVHHSANGWVAPDEIEV
jgi:hypothetical protein